MYTCLSIHLLFSLPDHADDDVPLVHDVLALPSQLHDQLIIGHPDGEHIVEVIPFLALPLATIPHEDWPFIVDLDDDEVPVFHVDHPDEDIGDGEVFDVTILEVASSVISVIDISSDSDSRESVTSSDLQVVGLEASPAGNASFAPATPTPTSTPTPTPPHTLFTPTMTRPRILLFPLSRLASYDHYGPLRIDSIRSHFHPLDEAEPSRRPPVPHHGASSSYRPPHPFPHSRPHVMPMSDPYHLSLYTRDVDFTF
ncbi:hypothetical protein Hanom_Chr03g00193621 [Helianthus anomalus]